MIKQLSYSTSSPNNTSVGKELEKLRVKFDAVFWDNLPEGLPPERDVDHKIETLRGDNPPHRGDIPIITRRATSNQGKCL